MQRNPDLLEFEGKQNGNQLREIQANYCKL